jgi:hypothetical protein
MAGQVIYKTVTDGLILYLDAANTKSYVSGSSTWVDISKNSNNGTLTNGPTYSAANNGSIVFDGVDDYVNITNIDTSFTIPGSGSIDFIYKNISPIAEFGNTWGFTDNVFQYERNTGQMSFVWRYTDNTYDAVQSGVDPTDLNIYHMTCTYTSTVSSSTLKLYKNGLLYDTKTVAKTLSNLPNSLRLGSSDVSSGYSNCSIFNFKLYNRELSATEILQNYNATKNRYI